MASLAARRPAKCHPSLFPATECAHDLLAAPAIIYTSLQVGFRGRFTQTRDVQQQAAEQPTVVDISGLRRNAADAALPIAGTAHATVLFADMRGYTGLAETLPPARLVPLLDEFFDILSRATFEHGGEVFHTAGDGLMAGFGFSDSSQDHVRSAFAAGRAMLERFATVAARWRNELALSTGIGVGIHLGEVALGILGPPGHKAMTLVGDTTNVAARLCSRARIGEMLFSNAVATALNANVACQSAEIRPVPFLLLPQFALRGRTGLVDVWCLPVEERVTL